MRNDDSQYLKKVFVNLQKRLKKPIVVAYQYEKDEIRFLRCDVLSGADTEQDDTYIG